MAIIAGVDGCGAGWIVVLRDTESRRLSQCIAPDFLTVLDKTRGASVVAVDIPIGLLDNAVYGGRACDMAARKRLGGKRASFRGSRHHHAQVNIPAMGGCPFEDSRTITTGRGGA